MAALALVIAGLLGAAVGGLSELSAVSMADPRPSIPPVIPSTTPFPTPTATESQVPTSPTPEPTLPGPWLYTVQAGESMSAIAIRFGTTTEELVRLNPEYADNEDLVEAGAPMIVPCTPIARGEGRCG